MKKLLALLVVCGLTVAIGCGTPATTGTKAKVDTGKAKVDTGKAPDTGKVPEDKKPEDKKPEDKKPEDKKKDDKKE